MRALHRIAAAWSALVAPDVSVSREELKAGKATWKDLLNCEGAESAASFTALSKAGDALVLRVAFGNPACRELEFWAPLTAASNGADSTLGWIRFKRGMAFNSMVLFEAIEVRPACAAGLSPEPSLRASIALLPGGP